MNNQKFPEDFLDLMEDQLKLEETAFLEALTKPSLVSINTNSDKLKKYEVFDSNKILQNFENISGPKNSQSKIEFEKIEWSENGFYLNSRPDYWLDPFYHSGVYYPQEPSSMILSAVFKQLFNSTNNFGGSGSENLKFLDLCAAPGGKSILMLDFLSSNEQNSGLLVSNEINSFRVQTLKENLVRHGKNNLVITNNSTRDFRKVFEFFDLILVDAPCSGEGMWRKNPESITKWNLKNLKICQQKQLEILQNSFNCLKNNGYLIYSTCTYNQIENEQVIESFLASQKDYELVSLNFADDYGLDQKTKNMYHCYPHKFAGEGLFFCVLKKVSKTTKIDNQTQNYLEKIQFNKNQYQIGLEFKSSKLPVKQYLDFPQKFVYLEKEKVVSIFPQESFEDLKLLTQKLKIHGFGTEIFEIKNKTVIPTQALALSLELKNQQENQTNKIKNLHKKINYKKDAKEEKENKEVFTSLSINFDTDLVSENNFETKSKQGFVNNFEVNKNLRFGEFLENKSLGFSKINLDYSESIKFLKGKSELKIKSENTWVLACYQNAPLGWLKSGKNHSINKLPVIYQLKKTTN